MSEQLHIQVQEELEYTIHIGNGLFSTDLARAEWFQSRNPVFLLIDERVSELYAQEIEVFRDSLEGESHVHVIPSGEQSKNMRQYEHALDFLLQKGASRQSPLIAMGGGVTGDLAGFVASTALRGIPLIQVATTLLAMVDSAIGGKTGINHSTGKNLIGSFYQPKAVYCDLNFLNTLDQRDWINGISEILKYGSIREPDIITQCQKLIQDQAFSSPGKWKDLISSSASIKADIVCRDAKEAGLRELLNFGHTFGHAIENFTGYDTINHGEAVFAGMLAELELGRLMGLEATPDILMDFRKLYNLDLKALKGNIASLNELMYRDKKVKDGRIRAALVEKAGTAAVYELVDEHQMKAAWEFIIKTFE